jgi:hypothetical protein
VAHSMRLVELVRVICCIQLAASVLPAILAVL